MKNAVWLPSKKDFVRGKKFQDQDEIITRFT